MGKKDIIKSLGKCIGNVVLHKIVLMHTQKPESVKHLKDEIIDHSADAFEKAHSWNEKEKEEIQEKSMTRVKNIITGYPDIRFDEEEAACFIKETMEEMML